MRIASLIIALLAGLLATAAIAFGVFDELVPVLIGLGAYPPGYARLAIALLPAILLFSAGMALAAPFFAAFLLLVAGIGLGGAAFLARQSGLVAVVLLAITGLAFILALIGGFRRRDEEIAVEEAYDDEVPGPARALLPSERLAHSAEAPAPGEPYVAEPAPRELQQAEAEPSEEPVEDSPTEPAPVAYAPAGSAEPEPEFGPDRDYFGEPRQPVGRFEPYDPAAERAGSGWRRTLIAANVVLLFILVVGGGTLVYLDHGRGSRSLLFGTNGLLHQVDLATLTSPAPGAAKPAVATAEAKDAALSAPPSATETPVASPAFDAPDAEEDDPDRKVTNPDVSPLAPPIPEVAENPSAERTSSAESMARGASSAFGAPQTATPPTTAAAREPNPPAVQVAANESGPGVAPVSAPQPPAPAAPPLPQPAPAATTEVAQLAPNDPAAPIPAPPLPSRIPHRAPSAPAPDAQQQGVPNAVQPPQHEETSAASAGPTYADPFQYCEAVDTIDAPDARYAGPAVPQIIAARLGATTPAAIARTHWRCMSRNVMACRVTGKSPVCDKLPTVDQMISYCKTNRSTGPMLVAAGNWSCKNGVPVIPKDQSWPVDRRGFFPPAWAPVPNIGSANG